MAPKPPEPATTRPSGRRRADTSSTARGRVPAPTRTARHLHRSGPHSLAVSLPKAWTDEHGLARGSVVWLLGREDGRLEVGPAAPEDGAPAPERVLIIKADHFSEPDRLARTVLGGYVVGHDRIELADAQGFDPARRREVEHAARSLVGLQVVFHDTHRIRLQSFLDPRRHPIPQTLERAGQVVDGMLETLGRALGSGECHFAASLEEQAVETHRLYALALRQLMLAHRDPALARQLDVRESRDLLGSRVVGKILEEVAHLLASVGPDLQKALVRRPLPSPLRTQLEGRVEALRGMLRDSMRSMIQDDADLAHRVLGLRDRRLEGLRAVDRTIRESGLSPSRGSHLAAFAWGIETARLLCGTVAEVALNESLRSTDHPEMGPPSGSDRRP